MKRDIYGHEGRYTRWKEDVLKNGEQEFTKKNSDILLKYIFDMEIGANVSISSKKGGRSFHRLNALRQKLSQIIRKLQEKGVKDITKIKREKLIQFFSDMRSGVIKTQKGGKYKSTGDYVKAFKSFWHWWMKVNRLKKEPIMIFDITEDLDSKDTEKPKWVYLNEKKIPLLLKKAPEKYAPLFDYLYCSGSRITEAFSMLGRDIIKKGNEVYADIREEISKGAGRKIHLKLCGQNILKYKKENKIGDNDLLFPFSSVVVNRHLKELAKKLFGDGISEGGEKYSNFTLYDFRHNSSCFWVRRYKTTSEMMYRFGWKSEKYVLYYSEFLGMKDKIRNEDMYIDVTKTELEKEIGELKAKFSKKNIQKEVWKVLSEYLKEKKNLDDYVLSFGSSQKEKPDLKTQKKLIKQRENSLMKMKMLQNANKV